jgi:hypothetical protein
LAVGNLPFLKRYAYEHQDEYRMFFASTTLDAAKLDIPIPLASIDRITLSPWIHPALSDHVKFLLRSIDGCKNLEIYRSTLIGNEEWKRLGKQPPRLSP